MNTHTIPLLLVSVMLLAACATTGAGARPFPAGATPFTADEIRDANPPGSRVVFHVEQDGAPAVRQTMRFLEGDADRAVVEASMHTLAGQPLGAPVTSDAPWTELRDHALFPPETTAREHATHTGPTGRLACWLYTVESEHKGAPATSRFYFAPSKPGPPVRYEIVQNGAVVFTMGLSRTLGVSGAVTSGRG